MKGDGVSWFSAPSGWTFLPDLQCRTWSILNKWLEGRMCPVVIVTIFLEPKLGHLVPMREIEQNTLELRNAWQAAARRKHRLPHKEGLQGDPCSETQKHLGTLSHFSGWPQPFPWKSNLVLHHLQEPCYFCCPCSSWSPPPFARTLLFLLPS